MKKKFLAVVLGAAMTLSMAACGAGDSKSSTESGSKSGSDFKVGIVLDVGGVNDGSFNQTSWEGLQKAEKELGIQASYLESDSDGDYAANIENFIDDDCDLIICVGYMLADATKTAAEENPDQKFAIIDDATIDLDNVACLMFEQEQASYLVGYVAGLTTKTNNVGFVLGMSNETMNQFGYGYYAGAIDANPNVKVQGMNANSFADAATGKADANSMITNGADIIFHAAGGTGLGVIEACQEAGISMPFFAASRLFIAADISLLSLYAATITFVSSVLPSVPLLSVTTTILQFDKSLFFKSVPLISRKPSVSAIFFIPILSSAPPVTA